MIKISLAIVVFLVASGFKVYNVDDNANLLNKETVKLIVAKNDRYLQTKEQPQIIVRTYNRDTKLVPSKLDKLKKKVYLVIGTKKKRISQVQIYATKDLHSFFTAGIRGNIIRNVTDKLNSKNKAKYNEGIRFIFRAISTQISKHYHYTLDQYDLPNSEQQKIERPHSMALPIAIGLVILIGMLMIFLKSIVRTKRP